MEHSQADGTPRHSGHHDRQSDIVYTLVGLFLGLLTPARIVTRFF